MQSDRELLEAAARAAGLTLREDFAATSIVRASSDGHWWPVWNPLTSDGDALRLAVKLEMDVHQRRSDPEVWVQAPMMPTVCQPIGADRYGATRRAIVRAAAALGATQQEPTR